MCGVTENLEKHYISYVPRIVIILCQNCHRNEHKKTKRAHEGIKDIYPFSH